MLSVAVAIPLKTSSLSNQPVKRCHQLFSFFVNAQFLFIDVKWCQKLYLVAQAKIMRDDAQNPKDNTLISLT